MKNKKDNNPKQTNDDYQRWHDTQHKRGSNLSFDLENPSSTNDTTHSAEISDINNSNNNNKDEENQKRPKYPKKPPISDINTNNSPSSPSNTTTNHHNKILATAPTLFIGHNIHDLPSNIDNNNPTTKRHISQASIMSASGSMSNLTVSNPELRTLPEDINNSNTTGPTDPTNSDEPNSFHDPDQGLSLYHLSGMPALKTLCFLSIGPILNQVSSAIEGIIQTVWVNKAMGKTGITAISSYMPFENICRAFGLTAACSGSNAVGGFIATKKYDKEEGSQVICDLLRVCLIIGIITPAVLCPTVRLAVKWFGASEEIVNKGYEYILPILTCTFITCVYLAFTGFLVGEGRTLFYACMTIVTSLLNVVFFCPLFLLAFKMGIVGAGLSTVLSQAIATIIVSIFYFTGNFTVKPKFNQLFKKFSPLTKGALKACLSQGIANLSLSIPGILIRKLVGKSADSIETYNNSIASFHTVTRWALLVHRVIIGFITGYLPAASFALNGKNYKRYLYLTLHVNWLSFAWGSLTAILTFAIPRQISMIFSRDPGYLEWATPMLRTSNSGAFFVFAQYTVGNMLRSLGMGLMAAVVGTLVHIVGMVGFILALYYTNKHDAVRLMAAYPLAALFGLVVGAAFIAYPYYKIYKEMKEKDNELSQDRVQNHHQPLPPVEIANFDDMA